MGTADTIFGGRVILRQLARGGYRTNVDALLLAAFAANGRRARLAVDLGAGVGPVALALLYWNAAQRARLIELDPTAAELAVENAEANGWSDRVDVVVADVAARPARAGARAPGAARGPSLPRGDAAASVPGGDADLVVCNPPYVRPGAGRPSRDAARARARSGDLASFAVAARAALGRRGRACFVYPSHDLATLFATLRAAGLEPKRLRLVHPTASAPARVALVEAAAAKPGGLAIEPPLLERAGAAYTPELAALLEGRAPGPRHTGSTSAKKPST